MKAARIHGTADVRLHEEPAPEPSPGRPLVRMTSVGLCGSDRHWFVEGSIGDAVVKRPLVLGHEMAGVIESGPRRGHVVAVDPAIPCGACELCREGRAHLCTKLLFAGHGDTDGGLREYITWPDENLIEVPPTFTPDQAALLEPLCVGLHALGLARFEQGSAVGVFGCGPIGLILIQLLRDAGAGVVFATDLLDHRIAAAADLGASVLDGRDPGHVSEILSATAGHGLRVTFDASGDDGAVDSAISTVRPGGRVVLAGIPDGNQTTFTASTARRKGLTLLLSRRAKSEHYAQAIRLVDESRVDLTSLVTARLTLEGAEEGFRALSDRSGLKIIIDPSRETGKRG
jgi:L-iditol 2-dehydrogenase